MKNFNWSKLVFFTAMIHLSLSGFPITFTPAFSQTADPFSFSDGYFKSSGEPVHLVHDGVRLSIGLGSEYNLWLSFKVNEGVSNSCSVREEQPCRVVQQLVQKSSDGKETYVIDWKNGLEFRTDNSVGFDIIAISVPRSTPFENVFLVVKIVKDDKEFFRKEWPVQVWPI